MEQELQIQSGGVLLHGNLGLPGPQPASYSSLTDPEVGDTVRETVMSPLGFARPGSGPC